MQITHLSRLGLFCQKGCRAFAYGVLVIVGHPARTATGHSSPARGRKPDVLLVMMIAENWNKNNERCFRLCCRLCWSAGR
jgi:hypothetical protein